MRSSPWMRGAPHVGFSATIWKIRCRTSIDVCLVPNCSDGLLGFRNQRPVQTEPARCHRTTVLGVTTMSACLHSDQNRRTATQKSLSSKSSLGRGCRRFRTASCCQSARFSRTRFRRLRQRRMSAPDAEVEHATELYQINGWGGDGCNLLILRRAGILVKDRLG
jgi:hypothetical protein